MSPADRDLTPRIRRHRCVHGVPLSLHCPACAEGRSEPARPTGRINDEPTDADYWDTIYDWGRR